MADVPSQGKPISEFDAGTLSASSLFAFTYPRAATGKSTGKISAAELGEGMGDNVEFEGLNSSDKTLFGAINEALAVSTENAVLITETFGPGSTGAVITDDRIKEDSIIDVYTNKYGVVPENVTAGNGRVAITMPQHSDTIKVALLLRGVSEGGNEMHNYSETEQVVGTWIDGRPVYEKTIYYAGGVSGAFDIPHGITNLDRILTFFGSCYDNESGETYPIKLAPRVHVDGNNFGLAGANGTNISIVVPTAFTNRIVNWYITIDYIVTST